MKNKGFTLIELLVVIAIIALLASLILFRVNVLREKGRDASIQRELEEVAKAAGLYYTDHKTYKGVCDSSNTTLSNNKYFGKIKKFISGYNGEKGVIGCKDSDDAYAVISSLNHGDNCWCVDWQGKSEKVGLGKASNCREVLRTTSCP